MISQSVRYRVTQGYDRAWLVPAVLFAITGLTNIAIAVTSAMVWPAVLAALLLVAAAGCVRGAMREHE
ncbi:hypothetical protein ACFFQW_12410 [Umezawaea endophytica]|uniref:Uncharacterized protein n=1 Tax=Umezawaea endophytica TaxID=1654476 RepID=A0A9X2VIT4_9PSEU|nr:hypothetical protein [Umezawaea endophytica]MCS7477169.1 hypothetical protein [Umezawaea endophytica]